MPNMAMAPGFPMPGIMLAPDGQETEARREVLVDQVKGNQRFSNAFKVSWRAFCDRFGRGFYDPARHSVQFLEDFFAASARGDSPTRPGGNRGRSRSKGSWRQREPSSNRPSRSPGRRSR